MESNDERLVAGIRVGIAHDQRRDGAGTRRERRLAVEEVHRRHRGSLRERPPHFLLLLLRVIVARVVVRRAAVRVGQRGRRDGRVRAVHHSRAARDLAFPQLVNLREVEVTHPIQLEVELLELASPLGGYGRGAVGDDLEDVIARDGPREFEAGVAPRSLAGVEFPPVREELTLPGDVTPDEHHLVFLAATVRRRLSGRNGVRGGEAELKGDSTLGGSDCLA